eukprot:TRINITY_DN7026_c0_g1_i2.p1 TRINITY_DN7026_c0_g1~~TRINITY_DN7026_c0_g1_i2.p1  ORF type:complete len:216 (+),score=31.56 TRINITY_DN7026_c0_g1_i2:63-650(+)
MKTTVLFLVLIITVSTLSFKNVAEIKSALTPGIYECGFCEFVIFTIYTYVTSSSTESQIATVVDEVCNYVPSGEEALCQSIINTYGPDIIEFIVEKEAPATICGFIGFCNSTTITEQMWNDYSSTNQIDSDECGICSWLKWGVKQRESRKTRELFLSEACDVSYHNEKCQKVVEKSKEKLLRKEDGVCAEYCINI